MEDGHAANVVLDIVIQRLGVRRVLVEDIQDVAVLLERLFLSSLSQHKAGKASGGKRKGKEGGGI